MAGRGTPPPTGAGVAAGVVGRSAPGAGGEARAEFAAAPSGGAATPPAATPTTHGPLLSGLVIAEGAERRTLVRTQAGLISVDTELELKPGTNINFEILQRAAPATPALPATAPPGTVLTAFAHEWPALREMAELVQAANPQAASHFLSNVPTMNSRLAVNVLFFVAALRGGDLRGWLGGEAVRTLERLGRGALVTRLSEDAAQLGRLLDELVSGD